MPITRDEVIKAAHDLVSEAPFRHNNGLCIYIVDDQPNCIVAAVVDRLGLDYYRLADAEGATAADAFAVYPGWFEEDAVEFVDTLQRFADGVWDLDNEKGLRPWAECLVEAVKATSVDTEEDPDGSFDA